ncbi:MAG: two-component system, response regulator, stage 0 sporulation protein A [Halanaerobium sp. 4-GBenrich]|jgi:two-component system response regulator (stage 0 sporulation protein A)|uniref:Stage 0 sporulation protein A homolog n=1 Tax=Halanaerobium congolense TaxID=54121 RepID=A0A1G6I1Q6_9FIRM|nr:sporulation transcription factor Spo0A [Halanaerobium congolense]ODS50999.1 MAG: two-component system, response regulator, stage 0 sporulation protein A [Halanaerobium sp. 4-GBenrich]TDP27114.1 two-component system response regulator (stage 0 sporulation protein A) [Halanaerobium congolense]TDS33629.1 two-component system response regulator (stage 0 sporulation protein A) [Halanaerobium congolense]SDC00477.1 two-component system, response regulator, stage 0 sporulation protein A [Halanaerobi
MTKSVDVLIVDDNKEFCQLLAEFFDLNSDFNVVKILHNGEQVLEYLKNNKNPDLMILDLIMPYLDGVGVLEELNSENLIKDMKIIALSAMGHDKIMKNVFDLGVHYYIMKPFDLDKLIDRINLLMNSDDKNSDLFLQEIESELKKGNYTPYITKIIRELGIPSHIKGYRYVRYAVKLVINDMNMLSAVTKKLYPQVAEEFDSTSSRVERAIRHAIDVAWKRGNEDALEKYFSNNLSENNKPTNSQFIARIADEIMVGLKVS